MKELFIDSADEMKICSLMSVFPCNGVTTNPTILKKAGIQDVPVALKSLSRLVGRGKLHVQVTALDSDGMIAEAHALRTLLGDKVYVKVPVDSEGLKAIKRLASEGVPITATAIYTPFQGIMAAMAGAEYLAVYFNRIENLGGDPEAVIHALSGYGKVLGASFKNSGQVVKAFAAGTEAVTLSPEVLESALSLATISDAIAAFHQDWADVHGEVSIDGLLTEALDGKM